MPYGFVLPDADRWFLLYEWLREDRPGFTVTIARREVRKWLRESAEGRREIGLMGKESAYWRDRVAVGAVSDTLDLVRKYLGHRRPQKEFQITQMTDWFFKLDAHYQSMGNYNSVNPT